MKNYAEIIILVIFLGCGVNAIGQQGDVVDYEEARSLVDSANLATESHQYGRSFIYLDKAEPMLDEQAPPLLRFKYHHTRGFANFCTWQLKDAESDYLIALAIAFQIQDTSRIMATYSGLSNTFSAQNKNNHALLYQEKALQYAVSVDSSVYYDLNANIALSHQRMHNYELALEYMLGAKRYYQRKNNLERVALLENNIGELYRSHFENYELARGHYLRAIAANLETGNKTQLGQVYHNLGLVFIAENLFDSAYYYTQEAMDIGVEMGNVGGLALNHHSLGTIYYEQKEYEKSISEFVKALELSETYGITQGVYYSNLGLGDVNKALGRPKTALALYKKAQKVAEELGIPGYQISILEKIYELHKEEKQFEDALLNYESMTALSDSASSRRNSEELAEIKVKYESDLAQAENEILKREKETQAASIELQEYLLFGQVALLIVFVLIGFFLVRIIRQRNKAYAALQSSQRKLEEQYKTELVQGEYLKSANELKNRIFSVLGHDFRAPLASISGMLEMISADEISRPVLKDIVNQLRKETDASLKTLQNILEWSRIEMNDVKLNREHIDFDAAITSVTDIFEGNISAKELDIQITDESNGLLWADENQFKSMATNLLSNAIKYSPEGGLIKIKMKDTGIYTNFTIEDEGDGIKPEVLDSIKDNILRSTPGTKGEKGTGIGLRIVRDFAAAHAGDFSLRNNPGGGATASVRFPKKNIVPESLLAEEETNGK